MHKERQREMNDIGIYRPSLCCDERQPQLDRCSKRVAQQTVVECGI